MLFAGTAVIATFVLYGVAHQQVS
ncbi:MAG: hypothetical protein QOG37_2349, partial [Mycobacterium sp.]|nr:hypothetical protein [Mycobacterium sp.]